jgi:hypothetical protein
MQFYSRREFFDQIYHHVDTDGRRYMLDNLDHPNPAHTGERYEYKGYAAPIYGWKVTREKMEQLDAEGRIRFGTKYIRLKRFLDQDHPTVLYQIEDFDAVEAYVSKHRGVVPFLADIPVQARRYFPNAPLTLELLTDPENGEQLLLVMILTEQEIHDAWKEFERFRQEWYLDNLEQADHKVSIDLGSLSPP